MRARVETVTPDMARKWLEQSEDATQRGLRKARVEKLAHAIEQGQWMITHQGIALSDDGVVLDGQHRLHAIILADMAVEMMVMRGVDPEVFHAIDTGASRTPSDSLKIAGFSNTNILAAMVRTLLVYDQCRGSAGTEWSTLDKRVTTSDILEYLEDPDNKDAAYAAIRSGTGVAGAVSRFGATTPIASANLILRTYPTDVTQATLGEFNARLQDGVMLPARSPILAIRRWLVSDTGYVQLPHTVRRPTTVSVYLKAINDYALGIERSLSIFRFGTERIPVPLPKGSKRKFEKEREQAASDTEARDSILDKAAAKAEKQAAGV